MTDDNDTPYPSGLSATVSVAMKINLGNYQSQDIFVSVSGIEASTTAEEVSDLLTTSVAGAYDLVCKEVQKRALALKKPAPVAGSVSPPPGGKDAPAGTKGTTGFNLSVLSKPKRETSAPKPPRMTKLEAMYCQQIAIFDQLISAGLAPEAASMESPEGSLFREAIRVKLMGPSVFDVNHEPAWEHWLQVLTKHRDEVLPAPDLDGALAERKPPQ